jgi:CheY-like chemotaxis protein
VKGSSLKKQYPGAKEKIYLRLDISDTGTGISQDVRDKIFDPFFTTKPTGEGTGLGLSVVHGIVKSLNGFISVSSRSGGGTTFIVYLPVVEMEVEMEEDIMLQNFPRGNEHILLVDDEPAIINSGRARLERLGYRVTAYEKSTEALEIFEKDPEQFDLVLTDYTMPNLTGLELTKGIHKIRKEIPVIICSGYKEVQKEIEKETNISFLKKPLIIRDLSILLRKMLDT